MEKILLDLALILIFTKLGGIVSRRLKMPEVLGALVAGLILGPAVLGIVQYTDDIRLLSNLGVILLMFLAGLETDLEELKKAGLSSFAIALSGVLLPLIIGTLGARLFFPSFWEDIFVGVILTATSVSISVETLTELGKLNSRAGINILGAAVIDDVLGLILISIILSMAQASDSGAAATLPLVIACVKIVLFCAGSIAAIVFLPKVVNRFTKNIKPGRDLLTFSLAGALLAACLAEYLGIAAITGAYICGLMLSPFIHKEYLERNVKAISSGFLSLVFFASVGIEASLDGFTSQTLLITLVMLVIAVLGKVIGCGGAARALRMSRAESVQIGVGMISRGEVALITANIGLQNHIISASVFLPTLIVVILTTVLTPALLKIVFSHKNEKLIEEKI
jgi:Kef-type K+ transport system membrane component KefB